MSERKGPENQRVNPPPGEENQTNRYTHLTPGVCLMLMRAGKKYNRKASVTAVPVDVDFSVNGANGLLHGKADSFLMMDEEGGMSIISADDLKKDFVKLRPRGPRQGQKTTLAPKVIQDGTPVETPPDAPADNLAIDPTMDRVVSLAGETGIVR